MDGRLRGNRNDASLPGTYEADTFDDAVELYNREQLHKHVGPHTSLI
jgi:hypothetical protein